MTAERFPLFLDENELLLVITALLEAEKNELRHHTPEKAQQFAALLERLIAMGERAV